MKKISLNFALLGGLTLGIADATTQNTYTQEQMQQVKERIQKINSMKEQMSQMNLHQKIEHLQNQKNIEMVQHQNMVQHQAATQFEHMIKEDIYFNHDNRYSD